MRGKESFEWDNPFYVGLTGLIGNRAAADAIDDADVLVMVGTDFPYREWLPTSATVIRIDTNAAAIGRRIPVGVGIHGDAQHAIKQTVERLQAKPDRPTSTQRARPTPSGSSSRRTWPTEPGSSEPHTPHSSTFGT